MPNNLLKRRQPVLFGAAAAVVTAGVAAYAYSRRKTHPNLPTVAHVDLKQYAGLWYEIARLPVRFEKGCQHVTAEYTVRPDGKVGVRNTCHQGSIGGPATTATASAWATDETNAKLKVQFFWPFTGDYWILALDETGYQYALVGSPDRETLWILSRMPHLPLAVREQLLAKGRELGFPVENMLFTPQPIASKP
ncbi:lipocalin family protein [Hymenobacter lapidiphilus]|uniref:Lipocalin family protein n=1 Tax=Hymenobacter lapidiphilus TaxID=2608003 RepID=A0A7Y7PNL4_9BACT|nr:lipocalin family protein [Hymenobacter lapidiphilus]NVO31136.1 lipocalin family protein [Hymenobacter lapidiphilus]